MAEKHLDLEGLWPDLFEGLDEKQKRSAKDNLAIHWHDGWVPNREDVKNLIDLVKGAITREEYLRRGFAAAERNKELYKDAPGSGYEPWQSL